MARTLLQTSSSSSAVVENVESRKESIALVIIVVLAALAVVSLFVAFSYYCYIRNKVAKRRKNQNGKCESACSANARIMTTENGLERFTFKQLHAATGGFSTSNVVGHGGFGSVYKGALLDGRRVAVKSMDRSGKQGEEEFSMEVELLGRLHSSYLLALVGYCSDNNHKLLVYDYMANGSLQEHLYPTEVRAMSFLDFNPSVFKGYALTGHLTTKSDVYSYGVVLLELLTGRVPVDMKRAAGECVLVSWALPRLTDREKVAEIMDPALVGQYSLKEVVQVAAIAAMCVQSEADYRPLMADVVQSLVPLVKHRKATSKVGNSPGLHSPRSAAGSDAGTPN
ncbi:Inactive protein kinase [Nymphaea thermarum]|nr:Inactive protein kinase [Nymphaea thermarum]